MGFHAFEPSSSHELAGFYFAPLAGNYSAVDMKALEKLLRLS
jgi:hypothetical protein